MSRMLRAAGVAVASILVAAGAGLAGPSLAGETETAPVTAHYADHAFAAPASDSPAFDGPAFDGPEPVIPGDPAEPPAPDMDVGQAVITVEDPSIMIDEASPLFPEEEEQARPKPLKELVNDYATSEAPDAEIECLAGAVYFEAKSEPLTGQLAVAEVIINRAKSGRFPASFCGVVKQRGQFSFIRGGRFPPIPRSSPQWHKAVAIAQIATKELAQGSAPRALFFHAKHVSPRWRLTRVAAVGNHVFYR